MPPSCRLLDFAVSREKPYRSLPEVREHAFRLLQKPNKEFKRHREYVGSRTGVTTSQHEHTKTLTRG